MSKEKAHIVWFKRDLRLTDHSPLAKAAEHFEPVLLLYIFEPSLIKSKDYDLRHWRFVWESLQDMQQILKEHRMQILVACEEVLDVFKKLQGMLDIQTVFSHEETGIDLTFQRDLVLKDYFKDRGIRWEEYPTNAVHRGLMHRNEWRKKWRHRIDRAPEDPGLAKLRNYELSPGLERYFQSQKVPASFKEPNPLFQQGGASKAWNCLNDFLFHRARYYNKTISAPGPARYGCSRLSPHITWGNISIRQVYRYVQKHYDDLAYKLPVRSFQSRLRWHCHFVQKFEAEPRMEFENLNSGYDNIRKQSESELVDAWKAGQTGFPMVDACMRSVRQIGYLNFRMRAMLVSFLTHHLWQPWQSGARFLGRQFLNFEPGIHYSQFQMQACTTGVNSVRIYNPIKQSYDHDPNGLFIKEWVPELRYIPSELIHEPWKLSVMEQEMYGCRIGKDYPNPLNEDIKASYNKASSILWEKKKESEVRSENNRIVKKHVKNHSGRD